MRKNEEEKYQYKNIKNNIYPWVKQSLIDHTALNGKFISEKDTPMISFVGDLIVVFVIHRGEDKFEILKDNMLPDECDIEKLYHTACENLVRDVEFVISNTMYGGFGIIADGHHEASAICFKHIWNMCCEKLNDDLVLMVPAKDTVLFAPANQKEVIEQMVLFGNESFERNLDKISKSLLYFSKEREELSVYEENN
ncbi:hypothetical protein ACTQ6A_08230 [Lachnospiraceae bacterium LCP25S3_G4]